MHTQLLLIGSFRSRHCDFKHSCTQRGKCTGLSVSYLTLYYGTESHLEIAEELCHACIFLQGCLFRANKIPGADFRCGGS